MSQKRTDLPDDHEEVQKKFDDMRKHYSETLIEPLTKKYIESRASVEISYSANNFPEGSIERKTLEEIEENRNDSFENTKQDIERAVTGALQNLRGQMSFEIRKTRNAILHVKKEDGDVYAGWTEKMTDTKIDYMSLSNAMHSSSRLHSNIEPVFEGALVDSFIKLLFDGDISIPSCNRIQDQCTDTYLAFEWSYNYL